MLAQPPGSVNGQLRLTEQGEVIASKYADPIVGRRNLGTLVAATMEATLLDGVDLGADEAPFHEAMEELSAHAFAAYRGLVYQTPGFIDYFRASTPINEIGDLNIGSRPAEPPQLRPHRGPARDPVGVQLGAVAPGDPRLLRLRRGGEAVPGKGSARKRRLATLRAMYARWPFFRTLVDRLDMVLAKMDMGIAARYAALVPDRKLRKTVFDRIKREHDDTLAAFFAITETKALLENNPSLARSLRNRIPYIDPLSHLQVDLLRRLRSGKGDAEELRRARPPHDQRRRRGPPQQRLDQSPRPRAGEGRVSSPCEAGERARERAPPRPSPRGGDRDQRMSLAPAGEDPGRGAVAAGVDGEAVVVGAGGGRELPEQAELAVGLREQVAQPAVVGLAALLVGRDEAALAEVGDLAGQRGDRLVALDPDLGVARGREAVVARVEVVAEQVQRLDPPQLGEAGPLVAAHGVVVRQPDVRRRIVVEAVAAVGDQLVGRHLLQERRQLGDRVGQLGRPRAARAAQLVADLPGQDRRLVAVGRRR